MRDKHDKVTIDLVEKLNKLTQDYLEIDNIVRDKSGKEVLVLNKNLIVKQGLTQEDVDNIKQLHLQRISIEQQMDHARVEDLKMLFEQWTQNQYSLQKLWGFPEDINYHPSHRLRLCSCPKLDNDERLGTPYKVRTVGCRIHD